MGECPRARSEGIVSEEIGDELVVYVQPAQTAHALSKDAAAVWRRCDGDSSVEDIAGSVGLEQARVEQALEELSAADLLEEPEGISRRALYKRAATLGAAAVSAPLIYSVAIRPAAAHASACSGPGCPGGNSMKLSNGTCVQPCTPTNNPCAQGSTCFVFNSFPVHGYCSTGHPTPNSCSTDADCPAGEFCNTFCIPATC